MECDQVASRLSAFALSRLGRENQVELEQHFNACERCRKAAAAERAFHQALQVTLPEVDRKESDLWSAAAGYRPPPRRRLAMNLIALGAGVAVPLLLLIGPLAWRLSFEDVLVLHHAQALQDGFATAVTGTPEAITAYLSESLGSVPILPEGSVFRGARPINAMGDPGHQLILDAGNLRISLFLFPPEALTRRPELSEAVRREGTHVVENGEFTIAMKRGRLWIVMAAKADRATATEWFSRLAPD